MVMLHWAQVGECDLDVALHMYWHAMQSFLPLHRLSRVASAQGTAVPLSLPLDDDPPFVGSQSRWSERNALTCAKSEVYHWGRRTGSLTKPTSRQLRVKE